MLDFTFWLRQQPPEVQEKTILQIIGLYIVMLIIGSIAEYIKRKREE